MQRALLRAVDPPSAEAHDGPVDPALLEVYQAAGANGGYFGHVRLKSGTTIPSRAPELCLLRPP
jgi:hypothetical protein